MAESWEGKEISFREGSTIAQGVASYKPWQCSLTVKGMFTSQHEGGSVARQLLQRCQTRSRATAQHFPSGRRKALTYPVSMEFIPSPQEPENPIHGENTKEEAYTGQTACPFPPQTSSFEEWGTKGYLVQKVFLVR